MVLVASRAPARKALGRKKSAATPLAKQGYERYIFKVLKSMNPKIAEVL